MTRLCRILFCRSDTGVPTLTAKRRLIFRWRKRLWQRSALAANRLPRGDALRPKKKIGELRLRLWARMSHSDVIVCEELFSVSNDLELSIKCRWAWLHFLAFICTIHHFWEKYHFSGKIGQLSPINAFSIFLVFVIRNEYLALYLLNPWEVACEWLEGKRVFYGMTIAFYCCFSHRLWIAWLAQLTNQGFGCYFLFRFLKIHSRQYAMLYGGLF